MKSDPMEKNPSEEQYEDAGITFKAGIMMIGPPGCGKSSTIRGILNRTKRHGILVRWSALNSCTEFSSLLRCTKINGVNYDPSELCFIFEDFDANEDDVLKCRSEKKAAKEIPHQISFVSNDNESASEDDNLKQELSKTKKALENIMMIQKKEDALTLECVLNTIDGIMELHNIMLIFTTNHLEKIDPAFTRPGRIDYILKLERACVSTIREMIAYKYRRENIDMTQYDRYFEKMNGHIISPADVQITCLKYGAGEIEQCLEELLGRTNS
jgi:chaperone BCS1